MGIPKCFEFSLSGAEEGFGQAATTVQGVDEDPREMRHSPAALDGIRRCGRCPFRCIEIFQTAVGRECDQHCSLQVGCEPGVDHERCRFDEWPIAARAAAFQERSSGLQLLGGGQHRQWRAACERSRHQAGQLRPVAGLHASKTAVDARTGKSQRNVWIRFIMNHPRFKQTEQRVLKPWCGRDGNDTVTKLVTISRMARQRLKCTPVPRPADFTKPVVDHRCTGGGRRVEGWQSRAEGSQHCSLPLEGCTDRGGGCRTF